MYELDEEPSKEELRKAIDSLKIVTLCNVIGVIAATTEVSHFRTLYSNTARELLHACRS